VSATEREQPRGALGPVKRIAAGLLDVGYVDVSSNADAILERLEAGTMPCDGAWPAERVAVFRRWIEAGKPA
jgi:hypothetical protein